MALHEKLRAIPKDDLLPVGAQYQILQMLCLTENSQDKVCACRCLWSALIPAAMVFLLRVVSFHADNSGSCIRDDEYVGRRD